MAKKKRTTTKRRAKRRASPKAMGDRRPVARRRGKRRAKRSKGLSDVFTPDGAKEGMTTVVLGFGGGMLAGAVDSFIGGSKKCGQQCSGSDELMRGGVTLGLAFVAGSMGYPKIGAGIAGGYGALVEKRLEVKMGLADDFDKGDYADDDAMSDYPDAITEGGDSLFLADDGNFYLSDDFTQTSNGDLVLSDNATPYNSNMALAYS